VAALPPGGKPIPIEVIEESLYEVRRKIYPRSVTGLFARWRLILVFAIQLLFYGLPWVNWNGRQAVLFDLIQRKFYIFGVVLWPQDVVYLTLLLILSALALSLFTAIAGRLFLWIRLYANGIYRNLYVDRAQGGRGSLCSHSFGWLGVALGL